MNSEFIDIAKKTYISVDEWQRLVEYLNHNLNLALATRMFYLTHTHSTHPFDYYVPEKISDPHCSIKILEYMSRAYDFIGLINSTYPNHPDVNIYFLAAQLVGYLDLNSNA